MAQFNNLRSGIKLLISFTLIILFTIVAKKILRLAARSAETAEETDCNDSNLMEITELGSGTTEETEAASDEISSQTAALKELLELFKAKRA